MIDTMSARVCHSGCRAGAAVKELEKLAKKLIRRRLRPRQDAAHCARGLYERRSPAYSPTRCFRR